MVSRHILAMVSPPPFLSSSCLNTELASKRQVMISKFRILFSLRCFFFFSFVVVSLLPFLLVLLFNRLDALPLAAQILLPQRDLVVCAADGQNVAAQRPADAPNRSLKVEHLAGPLAAAGLIRGPDADRLVLGG